MSAARSVRPKPPATAAASAVPASTPPADGTRERLLEAAARAVADHGFRGATVREICRRAGANVAAVNYHFGSKERLLAESLRWTAGRMPDDPWFEGAETADPRDDLRAAIAAFARRILGGREEWHTRLMLRAMAEPGPGLDLVAREVIEPRLRNLERVLRRFLPDADERSVRLSALCVVAQFAYFRFAGPMALRLLGERAMTPALVAEIAGHVRANTEHVLAGRGAAPARPPSARATRSRQGTRP